MTPEEQKKFVEKCVEALRLAERVIYTSNEEMVYPYQHPAFAKIFEKAFDAPTAKTPC